MKIMDNPQPYVMLKEKQDGIRIGALKFPILFANTIYLFPKDAGDELVKDGWAKACKPDSDKVKEIIDAYK